MIQVGEEQFSSKAAIKRRTQEILRATAVGQHVNNLKDTMFLSSLLNRHPRRREKVGPGVMAFRVEKCSRFATPGFVAVRIDGTSIEFSYLECITPSSPIYNVKEAMRFEVSSQVTTFRFNAFYGLVTIVCPITGMATTIDQCNVDHQAPSTFAALTDRFFQEEGIDPLTIKIDEQDTGCRFKDTDIARRWRDFHRANARMRIVHKNAKH